VNVTFVLVRPKVPENVGACARAVHTMGFKSLRLVSPCHHLDEKAKWLAHGSVHVLEKAEVFDSVKEALKDADFIVGTTARKRHALKHLYYPIQKLDAILKSKSGAVKKAAFLFGCEGFGLTNGELGLCDVVTYVPMAQRQPSLNLAQAVMVTVYEVFQALQSGAGAAAGPRLAERRAFARLADNIWELMKSMKVREPAQGLFHRSLKRALNRTQWTNADIAVFDRFCKQVRWYTETHCRDGEKEKKSDA